MSPWIAVVVATAVVVIMRVPFAVGGARLPTPPQFARRAAFVGPVVTASLLAPRVLGPGAVGGAADALAVAAALPIAVRTRSIGWTLAVGMPIVWLARALA